jgi:hypothetical protein
MSRVTKEQKVGARYSFQFLGQYVPGNCTQDFEEVSLPGDHSNRAQSVLFGYRYDGDHRSLCLSTYSQVSVASLSLE